MSTARMRPEVTSRPGPRRPLLLVAAQELLHPGQEALDLGPLPQVEARIDAAADWTAKSRDDQIGAEGGPGGDGEVSGSAGRRRAVAAGGRVVRTSAEILWGVLERAWRELGSTLSLTRRSG